MPPQILWEFQITIDANQDVKMHLRQNKQRPIGELIPVGAQRGALLHTRRPDEQ